MVPRLRVTQNAAFAISYDHEVRSRIRRLARKRVLTADYAKSLREENEEAERYLKTDLARGRPPAGANPYVPGRKKFPKGEPDNNDAPSQVQTRNHPRGFPHTYAAKGSGGDNPRTQPNPNAIRNPVWITKGGKQAKASLRGKFGLSPHQAT